MSIQGIPSRTAPNFYRATDANKSHTVGSGDTLSKIARSNNVSVNNLMAANPNIRNPNSISVGDKINIPGQSGSNTAAYTGPGSSPGTGGLPEPRSASGSHTVSPGDSLSKIARENNVTVSDLMAANPNISNPNSISVGDKINLSAQPAAQPPAQPKSNTPVYTGPGSSAGAGGLPKNEPAPTPTQKSTPVYTGPGSSPGTGGLPKPSSTGDTYTVVAGDSLSKIARDNNVSVSDLTKANRQISNPNSISVGDKINIPGQPNPNTPARSVPSSSTPVYTGPGSSPSTGGLPEPTPTPKSTPVYSGPGSSPGTGGLPAPSSSGDSHTVVAGDTLSKIGRENNVSVSDLMAANPQIRDANSISVGDRINIRTQTETNISSDNYVYTGPGSSPQTGGTQRVSGAEPTDASGLDKLRRTDHRYTVSTRSFAPPESFGGGFQGDSRGYTTDENATSRIHSTVTFDANDQVVIDESDVDVESDDSVLHFIPNIPRQPDSTVSILSQDVSHDGDVSTINFETRHSGEDAIPRISGGVLETSRSVLDVLTGTLPLGSAPINDMNPSPTLDVNTDLQIVSDRNAKTVTVVGEITGDDFPATEVFITDYSGQSVFLATGKPPGVSTPVINLLDFELDIRHISDVSTTINTDDHGNFLSVESGGRTIPIDDWNRIFKTRDPSFVDPLEGINDFASEVREGYGEIGSELSEAREEIGNSGNVASGTYEVAEGAVEVGLEVGEAYWSSISGLINGHREAKAGINEWIADGISGIDFDFSDDPD